MIEKDILKKIIDDPSIIAKQEFEFIVKILDEAIRIFSDETLLLELNTEDEAEIYILGDIHGNLESLLKLIKLIEEKKPKLVISLGDIVDRGPYQLECFIIILALKILNPKKFYILKGNHETFDMNQVYGFFYDFLNRYNNHHKFKKILQVYHVLPLCSIINDSILCVHGGIPEDFEILNKIKGIKTSDFHNPKLNSIRDEIFQILWNDPKNEISRFSDSFRGSGIKNFGNEVFREFMSVNNLKYLIRAHECFPEGYRWFFDKQLLSIFSSENYRGDYSSNPASYALIKNNSINPKIL